VLALLRILDGVCLKGAPSQCDMHVLGGNGEHVTSKSLEYIVMYSSRIRCSDDQCPMLLNVFNGRTFGTRTGHVCAIDCRRYVALVESI
jgi:hypothetical protein